MVSSTEARADVALGKSSIRGCGTEPFVWSVPAGRSSPPLRKAAAFIISCSVLRTLLSQMNFFVNQPVTQR